MSFGNMQHQQQHPLLSAISGNNYAGTQRAHYPPWHQHSHQLRQNPYLQQSHGRPGQLLAAASNHNGAYASTASGHSGYGIEPSVEYELQQTPPSGSYSSYHPSSSGGGGSGPPAYPPPHHHQHHHHQQQAPKSAPTTSASKKKKKSSGSVMSALTLLSFFFFVNMLQSCIKEHITDMNPTVMVLTSSGSRNRFNKLAEMNSREQTSSPASTTASASASASWQLGAIASSAVVPVIVTPAVTLHTPYSSGLVTNKPPVSQSHSYQQQSPPHHHQHHHPDDDYNYGHHTPYSGSPSSADFYPNRTHIDQSLRPDSDYYHHHQQQQEHPPYYPERDRHQLTYMDNGYAWSYSPNGNSHSQSQSPFHTQSHSQLPSPLLLHSHSHSHSHAAGSKRYSSSASLGAQSAVSSYSDNARYRQDYADDNDQRYNINDQRHNDDSAAAEQRRRVDDFYTHNNN
ncbi:uncharacterized protein LOC117574395 [Drosophila albomicans]|uniref:Uncharacterized protein LOC117574395 n=1 Tax=Drosophila albomicans TaxID=7291 RepID=A0A9C6T7M7_DROAB|nr:uncharacterized protein LOC117574395 [Drosophila albomicans]